MLFRSGTLAVKSSFNVSGVTDDGTGINTISFTNSMSSARSEERRVGKECRSRLSPYH